MKIQSRATLNRELDALRDDVLRLAGLVEQSVDAAMQALKERDQALAREVVARDQAINAMRFRIEEECLTITATQQPAARDLRTIIAAMTMVTDLERMGDHAAGIAKIVLRMGEEPLAKPLVDLPRMAGIVCQMLRRAMDAFVAHDADLAREVAARDDEVDGLYNRIFSELVSVMMDNPPITKRATYLLWVAHDLERIGDRVTNISERVIFMATGEMLELG